MIYFICLLHFWKLIVYNSIWFQQTFLFILFYILFRFLFQKSFFIVQISFLICFSNLHQLFPYILIILKMKFPTFKEILKGIHKAISFCDVFKEYPVLNAKKDSRYRTKIGALLTSVFIFVIFLIFLTPILSYFREDYTEAAHQSTTYNLSSTRKTYITNKNFFASISFKSRTTGIQVDPAPALQSFMTAQFIYINFGTYDISSYDLQIRQCNQYFHDWKDAPNQKYCLVLPDKVQFSVSAQLNQQQQGVLYFTYSCNDYILCSGDYFDSLYNAFSSFWTQNSYDIFFTTRYLDLNNKVKFQWNVFSGNQFVQGPKTASYIGVALSNMTYYVDDSIIPWKYNSTHHLETYFYDIQGQQLPSSMFGYYGIQMAFASSIKIYSVSKYYNKVDNLLGMLGGGIFILFLIFRCGATRYNRLQYQIELTNELYVLKKDNNFKKAQLSTIDQIMFIIFRYLHLKDVVYLQNFPYFKNLKEYQKIYENSNYDTDIVNLIKRQKKLKRNIQRNDKLPIKSSNFKRIDITHQYKDKNYNYNNPPIIQQPQSVQALGLSNNQSVQALGLPNNQSQFQQFDEDIIDTIDIAQNQFNTLAKLKDQDNIFIRYFKQNPLYMQIFRKKILPTPTKHSMIYQKVESQTTLNNIAKILKYFDIFKSYPSFTLERNQMYGSALGGCITMIAFILAVLTFFIGFQYFLQKNSYTLSTEYYDTSLSNIAIKGITSQTFKFALCFINKQNGLVMSFNTLFKTQASLELIQYDRVGSSIVNSTYPMQNVGDLGYFETLSNYFDSDYQNCYKIPDNVTVNLKGSPADQVQGYFKIKIVQKCYSLNSAECSITKNINRLATLNLLNNYQMQYLMTKSNYNSVGDFNQYPFQQGILFQQGGFANSSIRQAIYIDQLRIVDDKSIWRQQGKIRTSQISTINFYNNNADILDPDNNDLFYQLIFRPSGSIRIYTLIGPKFDTTFGMIGGIFIFMFGFFGFFTYIYNRYVQKMYIANKLFKIRTKEGEDYSINFLKEWLFILFYPFKSIYSKSFLLRPLENLKLINSKINRIYSLQYITKKHQIIRRHLKGIQKNQLDGQLNDIYLKQKLDKIIPRVEIQQEILLEKPSKRGRVENDYEQKMNGKSIKKVEKQLGLEQENENNEKSRYKRKKNGLINQHTQNKKSKQEIEIQQMQQISLQQSRQINDTKQSSKAGKKNNKRKKNIKNLKNGHDQNGLVEIQLSSSNKKQQNQQIIKQQQINNAYIRDIKKRKKTKTQKCIKKINSFISAFDGFGVGGGTTFQDKLKSGSWIGGLCSILALIFIILIVKYYSVLYLNGNNFIVTKANYDADSTTFYKSFKPNQNFKFAIGFISPIKPNIVDVSINTTANTNNNNTQLLNISIIQSTVRRGNKLGDQYSQKIYPLVRCSLNYINDGKFHYDSQSPLAFQNAYCLPDVDSNNNKYILQFQGDTTSDIQKWFVVSVAVNCGNQTDCSSQITTGQNFFKNYIMRYYISTPKIGQYPLKYKFISQPFIYLSSQNNINNVTINPSVFTEDNSIYPWNNPPNVTVYEYIYNANAQNMQAFTLGTNVLYKNITFNPSYMQTVYVKKVTKLNQILGFIGGIIAFILFGLGIFTYPFNKFKMHFQIGKRIYLIEQQVINNNKSQKTEFNVSQPWLFLFMIIQFTYIYKLFQRRMVTFPIVIKIIRKVRQQLNILQYFKNLLLCQKSLSRLLAGNQKMFLNIYLKKIIDDQTKKAAYLLTNILAKSRLQVEKQIQKYEISQYQLYIIYKAIENKHSFKTVLGQQAQFLEKYILLQKNLDKKRNQQSLNINSMYNDLNQSNIDDLKQQNSIIRLGKEFKIQDD